MTGVQGLQKPVIVSQSCSVLHRRLLCTARPPSWKERPESENSYCTETGGRKVARAWGVGNKERVVKGDKLP